MAMFITVFYLVSPTEIIKRLKNIIELLTQKIKLQKQ